MELRRYASVITTVIDSPVLSLVATQGGPRIKVYRNSDKTSPVSLPASWPADDVPSGVFVEGIATSLSMRDVKLELRYTGDGGPCVTDALDLTVACLAVFSVEFNSDHGLMYDNDVDYESGDTLLEEPEWMAGLRNHPISRIRKARVYLGNNDAA